MFLHVLLWGAICAKSQHNATFTRIKNIKKHRNKVGDDSIKQFSTQPHPTYLPTSKICRVASSQNSLELVENPYQQVTSTVTIVLVGQALLLALSPTAN